MQGHKQDRDRILQPRCLQLANRGSFPDSAHIFNGPLKSQNHTQIVHFYKMIKKKNVS